jgi:hypothetical protein
VSVVPEPPRIVEKLDTMVPPAAEPENDVLVDESLLVRWAGPLFALLSVLLVPWSIYLAATLPERAVSPNYDVAWVGFDLMLAAALAATAYSALRRARFLTIASTAAAVLLVVDAWFDVVSSPARQLPEAIALAVAVELPLAALCVWLSHHSHQLAGQRIAMLLRRTRRP